MRKILVGLLCCLLCTGCFGESADVSDLKQISFKELDKKILNKEDMVVYFGWTENCGDSKNFQDNYLKEKINNEKSFKKLLVVDLDKEAPKALSNRKLRTPIKEKYNVMYSPTLVYYENGEIKKLLEWTPATTDKDTGILRSNLDAFFKEAGIIKK
ncbi:MAG: thioredoxin family protein [Erysipelotrichaceae bacterium]